MNSTKKTILIACLLSAAVCISFLIGVLCAKSASSPKHDHSKSSGAQYSLPKAVPTAWFTGG